MFKRQKDSTLKTSGAAITELAHRYRVLLSDIEEGRIKGEVRKPLFVSPFVVPFLFRLRCARYRYGETPLTYQC